MSSKGMVSGAARLEALHALSARLGVDFNDVRLLDRALTHASATVEAGLEGDYESLEFLGDAVLGLAVSHWLFDRVPDGAPGDGVKHGRLYSPDWARIAIEFQ